MRALRLRTGIIIAPFGDEPEQAQFAERTSGWFVDDSLRRRGLETTTTTTVARAAGDDAVLVFADVVYASDKALGDFLAQALPLLATHPIVQLALARTPASDFVRPVSSLIIEPIGRVPSDLKDTPKNADARATERLRSDVFLVRADALPEGDADEVLRALRASAHVWVVAKRELHIPMRMPTLEGASGPSVMPISSTVVAHIEHWVHVLWLNQMALGIRMLERARQDKAWAVRCALTAMTSWPPWQPSTWLRAGVAKGNNVRIDSTAHVEASILGDNVVIGPRASVRNSIIGDGVVVNDHATVLSSVVGAGSHITPRTFMALCTTYPEAVINGLRLQVSLIGRGASTSLWAGLLDAKLQGAIDVLVAGKAVSTERSFLGSCVGHRAHVDAKVLLMPGRAVPNDTIVAMRPDEIIDVIPTNMVAHAPYVRDGGTLVLLGDIKPSGR
jgi:acetyltransferase-like isoleucine patch superfamily enzyme